MAFFKLRKKSEVPEELPKLAVDEIRDKIENPGFVENKMQTLEQQTLPPRFNELPKTSMQKVDHNKQFNELPVLPKLRDTPPVAGATPQIEGKKVQEFNKSFFNDLIKNINEEISDLSKLDDWYKKKFMQEDVVHEMKEYWENQNSGTIIQVMGKNFKESLLNKTVKLQELERDWQRLYFELIEKEEDIRKEEKELKKILGEFLDTYKKRQGIKNKS